MAAVAERSGRACGVAAGVVNGPPVGVGGDLVGSPDLILDVPLGGEREIVVAYFLKVALLPLAAVGEGDVFLLEGHQGVGFGEIGQDRFGVQFWIENDVGHARLGPASIDFGVTGFAGLRSDEAGLG